MDLKYIKIATLLLLTAISIKEIATKNKYQLELDLYS